MQHPASHSNRLPGHIGGWLFIGLVVTLFSTSILVPHHYQQWRQRQQRLSENQSPVYGPQPAVGNTARVTPQPSPLVTSQQVRTPAAANKGDLASGEPAIADFAPTYANGPEVRTPVTPPSAELLVQPSLADRRQFVEQPNVGNADSSAKLVAEPKQLAAGIDDLQRWPQPLALESELTELAETAPHLAAWTDDVRNLFQELTALRPLTNLAADMLLDELSKAADEGRQLAAAESVRRENLDAAAVRQKLRRIVYAMERRVDIWRAALPVLRQDAHLASRSDAEVLSATNKLRNYLDAQSFGNGWVEMLKLDEVTAAIKTNRRAEHVRDIYRAITANNVSKGHRQVLARPLFEDYLISLGGWAEVRRDLPGWLHQLEQTELYPTDTNVEQLASTSLFWPASPMPEVRVLSLAWQRHYRNANVRVALAEPLLNRMMPSASSTSEPVVDQILGAQVLGNSQTSSNVRVRLNPDPSRVNITLTADGVVTSDTRSTRGPVTFVSDGVSTFNAQKRITFDGRSIQAGMSGASASARTLLRGMQTEYDDVPLIGDIVRRYARNQHEEQLPKANNIVRGKVASQAQRRLDSEVSQRIFTAERQLNSRFLQPMERMHLAATPISLQTTATRMIARYRIAGPRQWGGFTPRPEAPAASWFSLQLHESLINNALAGLELGGRSVSLEELAQEIAQRLGGEAPTLPDDLPQDVSITFAEQTPVHVRFEEGRIKIVLRIAELITEEDMWNDFQVTAFYAPNGEGMETEFARDGGIFLKGEQRMRFRDRIALSGIFSRTFGRSRPLPIIPQRLRDDARLAGLTLAEPTVQKGWIGIALVPKRSQPSRNENGNIATAGQRVR